MIAWLKQFWCTHAQKSLATLLGSMAVVDLTPFADDFHDLLPWPHWHATFRLLAAIGIFWRASQARDRS